MDKQSHDNKNVRIKLEGQTDLFSGLKALDSNEFSAIVNELSAALNNLSELENSEKLREDAIRNGKAIIKNWQPPTNEQIDKILFNMKEELLA